MVEGILILSCLIPALHFHDGTWQQILVSGLFTLNVGALLFVRFRHYSHLVNNRMSYVLVVMLWVGLILFGTLPFLTTGAVIRFPDALFEATSGISSTGATIFSAVEWLPASILFWRSMTQWFGGFGIVFMVLALVPTMGINKYTLYSAEASGADNTHEQSRDTMPTIVRQTLGCYIFLTIAFILMLHKSGLEMWDSVNIIFTNISAGGLCIYNNGLSHLTHLQQYIMILVMFTSGINFALLYNFFSFRWDQLKNKHDQFRCYALTFLCSAIFVAMSLHFKMDLGWADAVRTGAFQTISFLTTTGSLTDDTAQWWVPVTFLFIILPFFGGMAGSTTGGIKTMRVLILERNVRMILRNRLHPRSINPVRLNRHPVSAHLITNVMVIFLIYVAVIFVGIMVLMLCGINATESIGASIACTTNMGIGLGNSGGFGCYGHYTDSAKYVCSFLMIMGRLECLTVIVLFTRSFWRRR